jgi:hypothetical protein
MKPTFYNRLLTVCTRIVVCSCLTCLGASSSRIGAQTLPSFQPVPTDASLRLARAVEDRVSEFSVAFGAAELAAISAGDLERGDLRRSVWQSIEGALDSSAFGRGEASGTRQSASTPLLAVLDSAIGAYMAELGHIALEMDRHGARDTTSRLAPLHPGEQGSGSIDLGNVGTFRQLQVDFRGQIAHPDGRSPAVVARFYLLPGGGERPIPGRLLIPTTGAEPSFRAEVPTAAGASETRDYGWRPRLSRLGSILELNIDGRWARVEDEMDATTQRRVRRDPLGFCDAACVER